LDLLVNPEGFENRKGDSQKRNQREKGGIDQTGGSNTEETFPKFSDSHQHETQRLHSELPEAGERVHIHHPDIMLAVSKYPFNHIDLSDRSSTRVPYKEWQKMSRKFRNFLMGFPNTFNELR
jgi:hypothetical protein